MYPGVIIEYDDQSNIVQLPITEVRNMPLYCAVFSSDKGPEEWTRVSGSRFFDYYGKTINFNKHGQPLLQAAMDINSGAELICKRLVAEDSTIANIGIVATVTTTTTNEQKKDSKGNLLYVDGSGNETTEVTETPAMEDVTKTAIKYTKVSDTASKTMEEACKAIEAKVKETNTDGNSYLLYVITDIGRGKSNKRIQITSNTKKITKSASMYVPYSIRVMEGSSELESVSFTINPNLIVKDTNISLQNMINNNSTQLKCYEYIDNIEKFVDALAKAVKVDYSTMIGYDVLFGCDNKGKAIDGLSVDADGISLDYAYGQTLEGGSNGIFGDYPFKTYGKTQYVNIDEKESADAEMEADQARAAWTKAAVEAFDGTFSKDIFNVDLWKFHAIFDANYPDAVKRSIEALAAFREDFIYFRDQGLGQNSIEAMSEIVDDEAVMKSMFIADYPQSYEIVNPYNKRRCAVTELYNISQMMVAHINNGCILPPAGIKHNMIISDAIYNTISFIPCICPDPDGNQKETMSDKHLNYASYIDNNFVVETLYTSQEDLTQWSYINNVMGIQEVIRSIRSRCPVIRYTFIDGEDLEKYRKDVEDIISSYSNSYRKLEFEYVADSTYAANKIFYAVIKVTYKDFIQTEYFKITAMSTVTEVEE